MARGILIGVVGILVLLGLGAVVAIETGMMPANADGRPTQLERWAAKTSLDATLRREAPTSPNPVPLDDANLIAGIKLYAQNCAVCHGAANTTPSNIAKGLYQRAPQLAKHGVEDDPEGVTYWKVAHGIRFTAMPAFGRSLTQREVWQLALLLKNMDRLPAAPERTWQSVKPPYGPP